MATHDYVIDNQSASAFRADLNNALQAIVTQNSSATAPATTYANMIWYDSANDQLKKRNEANSAWITLGTINEGTGTFTPSGERALASQAQAEAGIDNTTLMTPLRAAQAIAALTPTPTSDAVGSATAGLAAGAVGTYGFFRSGATTSHSFGDTTAGSNLTPGGVQSVGGGAVSFGATQSGTWRCMGRSAYTPAQSGEPARFGFTVWLRIA